MNYRTSKMYVASTDSSVLLEYLINLVGENEWKNRKQFIEAGLRKGEAKFIPLLSRNDISGWYLLLLENFIENQLEYEIFQGSRILPLFEGIANQLGSLLKIPNVEERFRRFLSNRNAHPDAELFELSIAGLYLKNNCEIQFIKETREKSPDLQIQRNGKTWNAECKRMAKISDYSFNERQIWNEIWANINPSLHPHHRNMLLIIEFKIELVGANVKNVSNAVLSAIQKNEVEHQDFNISWSSIDLETMNMRLNDDVIPAASPAMYSLISNDFSPGWGLTMVSSADQRNARNDPGFILGEVLFHVDWIFAAKWKVNARDSIEKKSRGVRKRLDDAIKQSKHTALSVHLGIELVEDEAIGLRRVTRFHEEILDFDSLGVDLSEIFCHTLTPLPKIDGSPELKEDVYHFTRHGYESQIQRIGIFS